MKVKYLVTVLFSIIFSEIYASKGTVKFSLDRESLLYYNGEYMYFTITMPDVLRNVEYPLTCKLVIQDSVGTNVIEKLLYIENYKFNSFIKISDDIITGKYMLYCGIINVEFSNIKMHHSEIFFINLKTFYQFEMGRSSNNIIAKYNREFFKKPVEIKGKVLVNDRQNLDKLIVVMQSRGDMELFEYTSVNSNGNFQFDIPIFGCNEIYFLVIGNHDEVYNLRLLEFPYALNKKPITIKPFLLPQKYLNLDSVRKSLVKFNYTLNDSGPVKLNFKKYINFDKTIFIDDYIALPTTFDIVKEIIPLKKIKKKQIFLINKKSNSYFNQPPLFLIDGFIASSFQDILALDQTEIESISMSYSRTANFLLMGRFTRYGILSVTTKKNNHYPKSGEVFTFEGLMKSN